MASVLDEPAAEATALVPGPQGPPGSRLGVFTAIRALAVGHQMAAAASEFGFVVIVAFAALGLYARAPSLVGLASLAGIWILATRLVRRPTISTVLGPAHLRAAEVSVGVAALWFVQFVVPGIHLTIVQLLLVTAAALIASVLVDRAARQSRPRQRVLIVGTNGGGADLAGELKKTPNRRYEVVGLVSDQNDGPAGPAVLGQISDLSVAVTETRPDVVVLADEEASGVALPQLLDSASAGFRVVPLHHFHEHVFGRVPLDHLSPGWFMSILHIDQRPYSRLAKRCLDLGVVLLALPFALLLFPILTLLVRLSGPGPILFRQVRLGEHGKPFEMLKFRTMVDHAEPSGTAIWAAERDPRITPIGRFLRRLRLDETPQLWNVVRGDMSVVGPRPERPEFVELLRQEIPFWTRRHLVKPGLTGWAQVRHSYTSDAIGAAEKLSYDLYYLKHCSLALDLVILARTAAVVISGAGSR